MQQAPRYDALRESIVEQPLRCRMAPPLREAIPPSPFQCLSNTFPILVQEKPHFPNPFQTRSKYRGILGHLGVLLYLCIVNSGGHRLRGQTKPLKREEKEDAESAIIEAPPEETSSLPPRTPGGPRKT